MSLAPYIHAMGRGPGRARSLSREEARDAMSQILRGDAPAEAVGALLMLMRYRGRGAPRNLACMAGRSPNPRLAELCCRSLTCAALVLALGAFGGDGGGAGVAPRLEFASISCGLGADSIGGRGDRGREQHARGRRAAGA